MSKTLLKKYVSERTGITVSEASIIIDVFIEAITYNLINNEKLTLPNFGSFKIKESKARLARNPKTGEKVQLPDRNVVRFKPAGKLKNLIK